MRTQQQEAVIADSPAGAGSNGAFPPVLHVIAPAEVGGLERVVFALVSGLVRRGRPIHVLAFVDAGAQAHPLADELRAARVPLRVVSLGARAYLAERAQVRDTARRTGARIVHTHGARVDVVDLPAARRAGLGTVTTFHGFTGVDLKYRFYEWLQCRVARRADSVVAVSRPIAARLRSSGVPEARLRVLPNAWSPSDAFLTRPAARAALGVAPDGLRVGWVGRLTLEKGPDVMVEAAGRLSDLPTAFSMLGDGREHPALIARARTLGLGDRLTLHGVVPRAARLMGAFDVLVLSSRTEGTPIVLFEALAAGVPVVATAVGGVPDVVSAGEALLVPPDDAAALADGIRQVVSDPGAAARRARAGAARLAAAFGVEPWLDAYEEIYRQVHRGVVPA